MTLNSKVYDFLKPVALIYLPALATVYFAVATIWGLPDTTNVVATFTAVNTALGSLLGLSSKNFTSSYHGTITADGSELTGMELNKTPEEVASMDSITLKVKQTEKTPLPTNPPTQPSAVQQPVPPVAS